MAFLCTIICLLSKTKYLTTAVRVQCLISAFICSGLIINIKGFKCRTRSTDLNSSWYVLSCLIVSKTMIKHVFALLCIKTTAHFQREWVCFLLKKPSFNMKKPWAEPIWGRGGGTLQLSWVKGAERREMQERKHPTVFDFLGNTSDSGVHHWKQANDLRGSWPAVQQGPEQASR